MIGEVDTPVKDRKDTIMNVQHSRHKNPNRMRLFLMICVLGFSTSQTVISQNAQTTPWSPLALDANIPVKTAETYMYDSDVRRAELGYLYSIPAFLHFRQRYGWVSGYQQLYGQKENPFGKFLLLRDPASPKTQDPSPNYDTLYGATYLDLSVSPVVLSVPDVPGRYYSLALLDSYFYNFEYVGSRTTGQKAGNYLIAGPGWKGKAPNGITKVITAPTNSMHMYQRIYFKDLADVPSVRKIQDQITIVPLAKFIDKNANPPLPDPAKVLAVNPYTVTDPVKMFEITNRYMAENPPPDEDRSFWEHFATVGVGPGIDLPSDQRSLDVLRRGATDAQRTISVMAITGLKIKNGWQLPPANVAKRGGIGGIAMQALVQVRTIGANVPEESVYYTTYTDGNDVPLDSSKRYTITFAKDQLPQTLKDKFGFWSITMMHRDNYLLVDNPANKYAVRSADSFVYGPDGSLTIYLQTEPPSDNKLRANWLPVPRSGGFTLNMRVYLGGPDVIGGKYVPPPVVEFEQ